MTFPIRYKHLIGWGILLYALMFFVWSLFIKMGFAEGVLPRAIGLTILIVAVILAARSLHLATWKDILPYSIGWAAIVALLDVLLTVPFTGWGIFGQPSVIIGYLIIILVPLLFYERHLTPDDIELRVGG